MLRLMLEGDHSLDTAAEEAEAYLQADIEYLPDESGVTDPGLSRRVFERFREVLETMGLAIEFDESLLEQPARISYLVAAHLAKSNPDKQQLLEMNSIQTRLEVEERWVGEVLEGLKVRKKVEEDPARPQWVVTEPGVGYRLRDRSPA